tara:strand:+ start:187 stop:480 length:294 start_codon:yes stop_codon:yes gene_type:complete
VNAKTVKMNIAPNISFTEVKPPNGNNVASKIKTIPIIKKPRGLPINLASMDSNPKLFFAKFLLNAKLSPKKPPNKIKKTWHIKGIIPPAVSIILPPK